MRRSSAGWFIAVGRVALLLVLSGAAVAAQDFSQWVDLQALTIAARYRIIEDSNGVRTAHQLQEQHVLRARMKADPQGRLALNVGAFTGTSLTSGWNTTGIGTGERILRTSVKQFFVAAAPITGIEAQVGSLYFTRGESTEITTWDNDAYLTGERVSIRRPRELFLDEISITHAFVGDLNTPNAFRRMERLGDSNYRQVLIGKKIGSVATLSLDWTHAIGRETWHAAVSLKLPKALDTVRGEYYTRPDDDRWGGALTVERRLARGVVISGGFASIDAAFGGLNADRFNRGKRVFAGGNVPLFGLLTASAFYTHAVENASPVPIGQRLDVIATFNILSAWQQWRR